MPERKIITVPDRLDLGEMKPATMLMLVDEVFEAFLFLYGVDVGRHLANPDLPAFSPTTMRLACALAQPHVGHADTDLVVEVVGYAAEHEEML